MTTTGPAPVRVPALTAVLDVTAAAEDGSAAALLPLDGATPLRRVAGQLAELGVTSISVVTTPAWADACAAELTGTGLPVSVTIPAALTLGGDPVVLVPADVVAHTQALASVLTDSRIRTGALVSGEGAALGLVRVAADDLPLLAELVSGSDAPDLGPHVAEGLAAAGVRVWPVPVRGYVWRRPRSAGEATEAARSVRDTDEDGIRLAAAVKADDGFFTTFFVSPYSRYLARWASHHRLTPDLVTTLSLLLGVLAAAVFATGDRVGLIAGAVLLQVAFTTDCVDGQLARYTRRFSPIGGWLDAVFDRAKEYVVFAGLALGASRHDAPVWGLAAAALVLQTARHSTDFAYFETSVARPAATLAAPATGSSSGAAAPASGAQRLLGGWLRLDRVARSRWPRKMITFPIGERFALISLTAAIWSPRVTFLAYLTWAGIAAVYGISGKLLRSLAARGRRTPDTTLLRSYRDDGPVARVLGPVGRSLPSVPVTLLAVVPVLVAFAALRSDAATAAVVVAIGWTVVLGAVVAGAPHDRSVDWLTPALLRAGEYALVLWATVVTETGRIGVAFAFVAVLAFHHYDTVYRQRQTGRPPRPWVGSFGLGWDGRLVLVAIMAALGVLAPFLVAAACVLAVVYATESVQSWTRTLRAAAAGTAVAPALEKEDDA